MNIVKPITEKKTSITQLLHNTLMFKIFDTKTLQHLDEMTVQITLDTNKVLFQQGQKYEYFYYVISGIIKLSSVSEEGEVILPEFY